MAWRLRFYFSKKLGNLPPGVSKRYQNMHVGSKIDSRQWEGNDYGSPEAYLGQKLEKLARKHGLRGGSIYFVDEKDERETSKLKALHLDSSHTNGWWWQRCRGGLGYEARRSRRVVVAQCLCLQRVRREFEKERVWDERVRKREWKESIKERDQEFLNISLTWNYQFALGIWWFVKSSWLLRIWFHLRLHVRIIKYQGSKKR